MLDIFNHPINKYPKGAVNSNFLLSPRIDCVDEVISDSAPEEPGFFKNTQAYTQSVFDFMDCELPVPPSIRFYGHVWPEYRDYVIRQWHSIHADIREFLIRRDIHVNLYDKFPDYFWKDTNELFLWLGFYERNKRQIMLTQSTAWTPAVFLPSPEIGRVLLHEIGHAIDHNISGMSDRDGFAKAYQKDYANIYDNPEVLNYFGRYVAGTGRCQTFAEMWSIQALNVSGYVKSDWDKAFIEWFPHSGAWIKANVPSAYSGFDLPADTITAPDEAGLTPFENLGSAIDNETVRKLLNRGADPLRLDTYKKTPLDHAIRFNKPDYVKEILLFLVEHPERAKDGDKYGVISRAKIYVERNLPESDEKTYLRNWLGVLTTKKQ